MKFFETIADSSDLVEVSLVAVFPKELVEIVDSIFELLRELPKVRERRLLPHLPRIPYSVPRTERCKDATRGGATVQDVHFRLTIPRLPESARHSQSSVSAS